LLAEKYAKMRWAKLMSNRSKGSQDFARTSLPPPASTSLLCPDSAHYSNEKRRTRCPWPWFWSCSCRRLFPLPVAATVH